MNLVKNVIIVILKIVNFAISVKMWISKNVTFAILKTEFRDFRENAKLRKNVILMMLKSVKF